MGSPVTLSSWGVCTTRTVVIMTHALIPKLGNPIIDIGDNRTSIGGAELFPCLQSHYWCHSEHSTCCNMAVTWWQWLAGYIYTRTLSVLCTARLYNYCVFKLPPTSSAQCRRVWVCVQSASNWFRWFKQSINTTDSARYDCMILSHSLMCLILLFLPNTTVPSPSVSISHDGGTESLYSGTSLTLTCVVTVSSNAVDISQVVVNSTW